MGWWTCRHIKSFFCSFLHSQEDRLAEMGPGDDLSGQHWSFLPVVAQGWDGRRLAEAGSQAAAGSPSPALHSPACPPAPGAAPEDLPAPAAAATSPTALSLPWVCLCGFTSLSVCPPLCLFRSISLHLPSQSLSLPVSRTHTHSWKDSLSRCAYTLLPGFWSHTQLSRVPHSLSFHHACSPTLPPHPLWVTPPQQPLSAHSLTCTAPHCVTRYCHRFSQTICAQHTISQCPSHIVSQNATQSVPHNLLERHASPPQSDLPFGGELHSFTVWHNISRCHRHIHR